MSVSKFSFVPSSTNTDGSSLTTAQVAALTFTLYADTVNPPVKSFAVAAGVAVADEVAGTVTIPFASIGFAPVANTEYFAAVTETNVTVTSPMSNVLNFTDVVAPNAPTGFSVA
jgi:hypothetical protein